VTKATQNISNNAERMAAGAEEQNAQSGEAAASVEQMTSSIFCTASNVEAVSKNSRNSLSIANKGGSIVKQTVSSIDHIAEFVNKTYDLVQGLANNSNEVSEISQLINSIAYQTNMLALNAAIEAERAGEYGKGFAVVAEEVRHLANQTRESTNDITRMVEEIQKNIGVVFESIKQGRAEVEQGKKMAYDAGQSLEGIIQASTSMLTELDQLEVASREQASSSEVINKSIISIAAIADQTSVNTQQVAIATHDLTELMSSLKKLISQFKIEKEPIYLKP
jgi:methyl-accepting chemotaxis protein